MTFYTEIDSSWGPLFLLTDGDHVTGLYFSGGRYAPEPATSWRRVPDPALAGDVERQLAEYAGGRRREFDVPIALCGTPFQRTVWEEIRRIPYGETISYATLAARAGSSRAVRAAGAATGRNPIPILVPCHRVVGGDGRLTGYAGGLERKRALLALESGRAPRPEGARAS
jgi:methylated-DNA-[protein]-cysteine S-methyltransferase